MDFTGTSIILLVCLSLFCSTVSNFFKAYYCKRAINGTSDYFLLNGGMFVVATLVILLISLFKITFSWYSFFVGMLFGTITFAFSLVYCMAINQGPISYSNVIVNMSTILTALSGWIFWQEKLNPFTIVGIVLMVGCMILSNAKTDGQQQAKGKFKWLLLVIFAMMLSACVGLCQKVHQTSSHASEIYCMLLVAFVVCSLLSFVAWAIIRKKEHVTEGEQNRFSFKRFALCCSAIGVTYGTVNVLNLYLSGVINTAVFFPIVNGIPLVLIMVLSFVFFKEKLTKKQVVGISLGILSLACLCLSNVM